MSDQAAIAVENVSYTYQSRARTSHALSDVSLKISDGELFALLGPNGGGKSTLFRLLATLVPLQEGHVSIFGHDVDRQRTEARAVMGVVFQAASLDRKLTVLENLQQQSVLYGVSRDTFQERAPEMLKQLGMEQHVGDFVETLSGGQKRRVEIAKSLIHKPKLLLMDEPTTGLDPGVRNELWRYVRKIREEQGVTILFTTHLLNEAEQADRVGILDHGKVAALASPDELKQQWGGRVIVIESREPGQLLPKVEQISGRSCELRDEQIRLRVKEDEPDVMQRILTACHTELTSITLSQPTLEDVFINETADGKSPAVTESSETSTHSGERE